MNAPIVLFVYNRPLHTKKTLEALSKNRLAQKSELFIFSDGPRENEQDLESIKAVRKVIREKQWCGNVTIFEEKTNQGLANSIIKGVSTIVDKYHKIIVLEDDILTSPGFLKYMNDALNMYENDARVMHISGYIYPVTSKLPETYFFNVGSCWGWATWKRAWDKIELDANMLLKQIEKTHKVSKFNIGNSYDFFDQLKANTDGRLHTWAIKWYSTIFLNKGFSLHPYPSLVTNIGHDDLGQNCTETTYYNWEKLAESIHVKKIRIKENKNARKEVHDFFNIAKGILPKPSLSNRIKHKIKLILFYVGIYSLLFPQDAQVFKKIIDSNKI